MTFIKKVFIGIAALAGILSLGSIAYADRVAPTPQPIGGGSFNFLSNVGLSTSSPWRILSVNGSSDLGTNALAGTFTATSSGNSFFAGKVGIGMASFSANDNSPLVVSGNSQTSVSGDGSTFTGPFRIDFSTSAALIIGALTNSPFSPFIQAANQNSNATYPLQLNPAGAGISVGSSSPTIVNAVITAGPNTTGGTTTISTGKIQFDGYNSAGVRTCAYLSAANAWIITAGACSNP